MNTQANINTSTNVIGSSTSAATTHIVVEDPTVDSVSSAQRDYTTEFMDDANVVTRDMSQMSHIDQSILNIQDTNRDDQSIISFLAKPIILSQGTFNITDTYSFLDTKSMPYSAFTSSQGVVWTQKLAGVYGIRMDMKFRIVVNADRFQQGRYCMGWVPLASPVKTTSNLKELNFNNTHMATLVQRTTVPHVEFDLASDTVAELVVPFVSSRSFYNLNSVLALADNYPLGYINVYPYSPLVSPAGSTTAGYTVYVSFENVKLFGAASAQSGLQSRRYDKELGNKFNGPISGPSAAIAKGFKEFANIPLLSSYATPISWIADRVSNVASIFGWSKPLQGDSTIKFQQLCAPGHSNVDGDSDARALSFNMKPGVVKLDGFSGTSYDEMDFSYIVRKTAWFKTDTWNNSQVSGTVISTISVTPKQELLIGGAYHYQPVAFVSRFFNFWRGSLVYRLKLVRTEFHSGRLQIAFFPGDVIATNTGNAAYVHRTIIDVREKSEVEFIVPFINNSPWKATSIGTILVTVVDPLVAPATVSNSVTLLWEISGGEDIEFASPSILSSLTPTLFVPQSGLNEARLIETVLGSSSVEANPIISTSVSIGEKITSFRSFLKRFTPIYPSSQLTTASTFLDNTTLTFTQDVLLGLMVIPPTDYWRADLLSTIGSCYAVWRGGVRVRCLYNTGYVPGATTLLASANTASTITATGTVQLPIGDFGPGGEICMNDPIVFQELVNNPAITVEMPQYTNSYGRSVCDALCFQGASNTYGYAYGSDSSMTSRNAYFTAPRSFAGVTKIDGYPVFVLHRAIADDSNFGCFISVPAMISGNGATSSVNNRY